MVRVLVTIVLALAAFTACSSPAPAMEAWSTDEATLGPPVVAGEVAIAYVGSDEDRLDIAAWALDDGRELWRYEALPGFQPSGISLVPSVVTTENGDVAAYLTPGPPQQDGTRYFAVALVDVKTGESHLASEGVAVVPDRLPAECESDHGSFCFEGRDPATNEGGEYRVQAASGDVTWKGVPEGFDLGGGLRLGDSGALALDGEDWTSTYEAVFGAGYSSAAGWHWVRDDGTGYLVGSAGRIDEESGLIDPDLTTDVTVALDPTDGSVVWSASHVTTNCAAAIDFEGVWCRTVSGRWDQSSDPSDPIFENVDVVVEGFDPATGDIRWAVDVVEDQGVLWGAEGTIFAHPEGQLILVAEQGTVAVDALTGTTRTVDASETLGCLVQADVMLSGHIREEVVRYRGEPLVRLCDGAGEDRPGAPLDLDMIGTFAVDGGAGRWLVAENDGLHLFSLP